jgi:hypothetical protein
MRNKRKKKKQYKIKSSFKKLLTCGGVYIFFWTKTLNNLITTPFLLDFFFHTYLFLYFHLFLETFKFYFPILLPF